MASASSIASGSAPRLLSLLAVGELWAKATSAAHAVGIMAATQLRVPLPASGANTRLVLAASSRQASMPDWLAAGVSAGFVPNVCAPRENAENRIVCTRPPYGQMLSYIIVTAARTKWAA
jgi:hypothetical protein